MMDTIRKAANHITVKIIFAIIILCFIFTGIGFLGFGGSKNSAQDEQNYIAKVDGYGISRYEFEKQAELSTANSAGDVTFIKQLRRNVLSQQIDHYLAYKLSQDLNTYISNDRVKAAIREQKDFFEKGQFSNSKYLAILKDNGYTPDSYAEALRTSLQQQQVVDALLSTEFVLPINSEIDLLKNQTRKIYATEVNPSIVNMDDVNITTEDEQKYYEEHQNQFFKKDRVKIKYIVNSSTEVEKTIHVTDDEVKQEFNTNTNAYSFPAKKAFSIIYVTNKEQADDIIKELSSGTDFDSLVKTVNQNRTISSYGKNGSLGWFTDDNSLPQVFKEANLDNIGQISSPIADDNGYLIVKLDGIQKSVPMDFDYAKSLIYSKLKKQKFETAFLEERNKIQNALNESPGSIEELANKTGLEIYTSKWISYKDQLSILYYPEVNDVVFSNEMIVDDKPTNKISDLISVGSGLDYDYVVQVVDYRTEGIAPFDEVQSEINQQIYNNIANTRFKSAVDSFLTELKETGSSKKIQFAKNYTLTRNSKDLDQKVVDMVFDLIPPIKGKRVFGAEFLNGTSAYIITLTGVNTPEDYQDTTVELLPVFIKNTYSCFIADLRSKAKIELMPNANL